MTGTFFSLVLAGALQAGALQVSLTPDGAGAVRVPIRAAAGAEPGRPEVHAAAGAVLVEVPEGRVERTSAAGSGVIESVSTATSHSRHRATVTLRLSPGATLGAERVAAALSDGVLTVRVLPGGAAPEVRKEATTEHEQRTPAAVAPSLAAATAALGAEPRGGAASLTAATAALGAEPRAAMAPAGSASAPGLQEDRPASTLALRVAGALGLLALAAWLAMRQRWTRVGDVRPTAINIIATRMLGKRERLMVIDVNQQRFLLSASEQGGVRLVSPIEHTDAIAEGGAAQEAAAGADPLKTVFADMLADVSDKDQAAPARASERASARPSERGTAARPPASPAAESRPALHLVVDDDPASNDLGHEDDANQAATREERRPAPAAPSGRPKLAAIGDRGTGNDSTDVAGLMALRQHRQRAGR